MTISKRVKLNIISIVFSSIKKKKKTTLSIILVEAFNIPHLLFIYIQLYNTYTPQHKYYTSSHHHHRINIFVFCIMSVFTSKYIKFSNLESFYIIYIFTRRREHNIQMYTLTLDA